MSKRNPFGKLEERAIRHAVSMNLTNQQIADSLGISFNQVVQKITELGLTGLRKPSRDSKATRDKAMQQGRKLHHRHWSHEELDRAFQMHCGGQGYEEIAHELGRTTSAIKQRLSLIQKGRIPGYKQKAQPEDVTRKMPDSSDILRAEGSNDLLLKDGAFVMENEFFKAFSVHLDGGLFGVVVEAKLASLGLEAMTYDALLAWRDILNMSGSWIRSRSHGMKIEFTIQGGFAWDSEEFTSFLFSKKS